MNSAFAFSENLTTQLTQLEKMQDKNKALTLSLRLLTVKKYSPTEQIAILQNQASIYYQLGDLDNAIAVTEKILPQATVKALDDEKAKAYKMIGVYNYYKGENMLALAAYQQSLSFYQIMPDKILQANLHNNIALVYAVIGNNIEAINSYKVAEKIYQQLGSQQDQVDVQFNIAGLYLRLKRIDIAIKMFHQVINKLLLLENQVGLAMAYGDLGSAYKYSGQLDKAKGYLEKSQAFFIAQNMHYHAASQLHNLAELFNMLEQYDMAIEYANQAIALSLQQGHNIAYTGSLYSIAKALFHQGDFQQSLVKLQMSDKQARKMGYQQQINENLALFSLIYAVNQQPEKALASHEKFVFENNKRASDALNVQLALFESDKLEQQVTKLQQNKKLQQLQMQQISQQRNMLIVVTLLIFVIVLFLSRRHSDRKSKLLLESKVKQRTEQLQASTLALKKADKVKSEFLANMSHEIRTPLTAVIGQAEAIMHGEVDHHEVLKEVGIIYSNSMHLLALINNILDLSRVEADKLELELQPQNLHEILVQLTYIFSEQAKSKGLSFEITHQLPHPFYLLIDGLRLKQVLINLCSNAIKFTANGAVKVKVMSKNQQLVFMISDTGIGLSYAQLQRIFDSFTQGDSTISRRFGGSGLGLCLSERLAKLMGGKIELDSTLGQGSNFSLILPLTLTSDTPQLSLVAVINNKIEQQITVVSKKPMAQFSGKVLIADDHQDNLNLITRFLQSLGLEVFTANNGKQAIEMFIQHTPQLVLLDIQMPEMDGLEAFNILRQQGCTQPIYALTANAMSHEVDTYLAKGFNGHLKKPIERSQFITTLSKVFNEVNINSQQTIESLANVDMSDLIGKFKSNLVLEQEDIILHIKNNELTHLSCISHRIAGAAQMFGYPRLSKIALKVELAIKSENTAILTELSQTFLDEIEQVLW